MSCTTTMFPENSDASPLVDEEVDIPSPDLLLQQCKENIVHLKETHEDDLLIEELVRCTALSRIVFGDNHCFLARSYVELAEAYLELKHYPDQSLQHAKHAKSIMLHITTSQPVNNIEFFQILVKIYDISSRCHVIKKNFVEAEHCLVKAYKGEQELNKLKCKNENLDVTIAMSLGRLYLDAKKLDDAARHLEYIFNLISERCGRDSTQLIPVYLELAKIEQQKGRKNKTIDILKKAYSISSVRCINSQDHAAVCYYLGQVLCNLKEDISEGESYLQESLVLYQSLFGFKDAKVFAIQDDLIKHMVKNSQYSKASKLLHNCLRHKKVTFGELSSEVISSYKLLGSLYLVQEKMKEALKYLRKCLFLERILYGQHHKRSKMTEHAVEVILKNSQVSLKK